MNINRPHSHDPISRRSFIKNAGFAAASAAVLASPYRARAQEVSKTVTLAFAGVAHVHTPSFIKLLKSRPDVRVKTVWDHEAVRAEKRAGELGCHVTADVNEIWSDPEVAGVIICSETSRHHDLVLAGAHAKKHMFAEKPLGMTARESREMADAIEKAGLFFTTGYFMRTQPAHLFLKEQIAAGAFGKITRVRGSNCHGASLGGWFDVKPNDPANTWRWMADLKTAGIGGFGDLGTHSLDLLMWMIGDVDAVAADIKAVTGHYGDIDECGEALLKFKNGVTGTLGAGWVDVENPVTLLISGTEGHAAMIRNELYFKSTKVAGADGKKPWMKLPEALPLPMLQFVDAIAGKPNQPLVTPREAAARVSVIEAAYSAARQHAWLPPA
jgi:predicted dehydrogenase